MSIFGGKKRTAADVAEEFAEALFRLYPRRLKSLVLYGSAARGEHVPGRSDLNFLVILDEVNPSTLEEVRSLLARFRGRQIAPPVLIEESELPRQASVFAVEFADIRRGYRVLRGSDVIARWKPKAEDLTQELKHELHRHVMRLRRAYVELGGQAILLREYLAQAFKSAAALLAGVVHAEGGRVDGTRSTMVARAAEHLGLAGDVWKKLAALADGDYRVSDTDLRFLYGDFLEQLERLADRVERRTRPPSRRRS